jgi:hypothetical protein
MNVTDLGVVSKCSKDSLVIRIFEIQNGRLQEDIPILAIPPQSPTPQVT